MGILKELLVAIWLTLFFLFEAKEISRKIARNAYIEGYMDGFRCEPSRETTGAADAQSAR